MGKKTIAALVEEIESARQRLLGLLDRSSPAAAASPVGEGRWSPIQYVEHLARAEEATLWRMFTVLEDARAGRPGVLSTTPDESIEQVTDRTWGEQVEAPPLAVPRWGGPLSYWATRMRRNRDLVRAFADLVVEPELDAVAYEHPISGPFTLRQGFEFIRFHIERHHGHLVEQLIAEGTA